MIRTIDNLMMINQTTEASKVVGSRMAEHEQVRAVKTEMEKERVANEQRSVNETKSAEHRRIQEDENRKNKKENMLKSRAKKTEDQEEETVEEPRKLNTWNMGREIDITV